MKDEILLLLRKSDGYVSGQELCEHFKVSRTAVWKAINKLKAQGYDIEAVPNRGYRFRQSPDVITKTECLSCMKTEIFGRNIEYYDAINSTNTRAKIAAEEGAVNGTLIIADKQEGGKGRRGRIWQSPGGVAIYMSLVIKPDIKPEKSSMLTLVSALAVSKAIDEITGLSTSIKWPNDIVYNGRKICGILTEMSAEPDYIHFVVVGIGINVNTVEFPEEIAATATSLKLELKRSVKRSLLIAKIMEYFERYYRVFLQTEDLSLLLNDYQNKLANIEKKVRILSPGNEYEGIAKGINETGELLVCDNEGNLHKVISGEVSVRGIYGYV